MKPLGCDPNNVSKDLWYSLDQAIKEMETESQPQLSDIRGMFHVLSHSVSKSQVAFSVPLGPPPGIAKDREVRFLVGDLNLVGRRRYQNLLTSGLAVCLLMLLSSVWLVVSYPNRRLRQQMASLDGALKAVETMVSGLPLGYCRLNGKDGFVDLNGTFATILGFHTIIDAKKVLDLWTFWGLLADEASRVEYERIQRARRKGEPTGPYFVRLSRLGSERKETVAVRVHGAAVPSPAGSEEDFPQTFAILEPQDPEATKQDDMMP
jgi:PAS domain-containing protein